MAKKLPITQVKPGMVILAVVEQNGPVRIRKSGLVTSEQMVQGLAEMGVITVTIDPEQTVELEADEAPMSQTEFVMAANAEQAKPDTDSNLAEQFNRSLFLPSLQKVPSAWQYYGKNTAIAILVLVGGFAIGWLGATYKQWLPTQPTPAMVQTQEVVPVANAATQTNDAAPQAIDNQGVVEIAETTGQLNDGENALLAQNQGRSADNITSAVESDPMPVQGVGTEPADAETIAAEDATEQASEEAISPELMRRFEQAMADLEAESSAGYDIGDEAEQFDPSRSGTVDYYDTVQRVDELPARIMARLPNMSFSAHMYATNPRDRWVKVNGVERGEGEWITDEVFLEKIEPQKVILLFQGQQFSMRALSDW